MFDRIDSFFQIWFCTKAEKKIGPKWARWWDKSDKFFSLCGDLNRGSNIWENIAPNLKINVDIQIYPQRRYFHVNVQIDLRRVTNSSVYVWVCVGSRAQKLSHGLLYNESMWISRFSGRLAAGNDEIHPTEKPKKFWCRADYVFSIGGWQHRKDCGA